MSVHNISYIGVDVAKLKFDFFASGTQRGVFSNESQGIAAFIEFCKTIEYPCIVAEATGGYEKAVLNALCDAGIRCVLLNPKKVRAFAESEGIHAKTDRIDAKLLHDFARNKAENLDATRKLFPYQKPLPQAQRLRSLCELRTALKAAQTHVRAQSEIYDAFKEASLKRQEAFVAKELERIEKELREHVRQTQDLSVKSERMQQVKGVGPMLAATLLAFAPELGNIDSKELCSLVGVSPYPKESGTMKGKKRPRRGRQQVKKVLYMSAVSASRTNLILSAFYQKLKERGKPAKVAIAAIMRKLLCLLNRLIADPDFSLA